MFKYKNANFLIVLVGCDHHQDDYVSVNCDSFGGTSTYFFGEYEGNDENLVCGIKLEDVSYSSETTWTVDVRRCYNKE